MSMELLDTLEQIEREKNIKKEDLMKMVEAALLAALRKHLHTNQNIEVNISRETGEIEAFQKKKVVEEVKRSDIEISLKEAQQTKPKAKVGEDISLSINTKDFGRIAAQTAKQVIIQRLLETEREHLYEEYKGKEMELINGVVQRVSPKGIVVDLGKTEANLPPREQMRSESYRQGERIKVLVLRVNRTTKGPQVIVSRTHPYLIEKLFELEVPEVYEKIVEIKNVVREPGQRAKIAVSSHNEKVDPVGACVGIKGSRIRNVIDELHGERIDVIVYDSDPSNFVAKSLSPAKVENVSLDSSNKRAEVTVADDQLSLAIGKAGQNVRLAAKLTGWHIDIKSHSERKAMVEQQVAQAEVSARTAGERKEEAIATPSAQNESVNDDLTSLSAVGEKLASELKDKGFNTVEKIARASVEDLLQISGIGEKKAQKILAAAKKLVQGENK